MFELWLFIISAIIIGLAVEAVTEIFVVGEFPVIFWLRTFAIKRALPNEEDNNVVRWYHVFFYKLLTCGYCCSVWVAMLFVVLMPGKLFEFDCLNNIIVKIFLLHRFSNWWHSAFELFRRGRVNTVDINFGFKPKDEEYAS